MKRCLKVVVMNFQKKLKCKRCQYRFVNQMQEIFYNTSLIRVNAERIREKRLGRPDDLTLNVFLFLELETLHTCPRMRVSAKQYF